MDGIKSLCRKLARFSNRPCWYLCGHHYATVFVMIIKLWCLSAILLITRLSKQQSVAAHLFYQTVKLLVPLGNLSTCCFSPSSDGSDAHQYCVVGETY